MKVTGLQIVSDEVALFTLSLQKAPSNAKFILKAHSGLDADEIIRKFYGFSNTSRTRLATPVLPRRDIVLRIQLNPDYSIDETFSDIRDDYYRAISLNRSGILGINLLSGGGVVATISGFIKKVEVPLSSETPELQLTLECIDPMFRGINPVVYTPDQLSGFSPVVIGDSISTAPHGMTFVLEYTATDGFFRIQDKLSFPEWKFQVVPEGGFLVGDRLTLSSEFGQTVIYLTRDDEDIPLMDTVEPGSYWPVVYPKTNYYYPYDTSRFDWISISYYPAFWGV